MTTSEVWTAQDADEYDERYADQYTPEVLGPSLDRLKALADGGRVLELAIGTGRIGVGLHERGLDVVGIELSAPMATKVHEKIPAEQLPVVVGDMASATAPGVGEFALVVLAFNTLSNLCTQDEQVECFRNAARHLRPSGRFVIELWVPPIHRMTPGTPVVPMAYDDDGISFDTYDLDTQACTSQSYRTRADGSVRHGTGRFRYAWPAECDLMARLGGMTLEHRWADWSGDPFTSTSESHVSVYRKDS